MPITVGHALTATTPNDTNYEIQVSHWNQTHAVTFSPANNELIKFISAGAESASSGTVVFSNSNGLSFGMNAGTITGSHNAITSQSVQTQSLVSVLGSTGNISFANSNGITFGGNASTVTASHNGLTTAAASNHSHGNPTLALTNLSGTTASNSAGLTLSLSAGAPGAATATYYAVGNTTVNSSGTVPLSAMSMRGYGIVSIGTSNGSVLFSTPDAVDFTQLSVGFSTGGNTAGTTGLVTGQLVLAGGANITLSGSTNGGSQTISIVGGGGSGGGVGLSAGTQSVSTGTVVYSNSNNISFGMSGSSRVTASAALNLYGLGNTTQNSSTVLPIDAVSFNGLGAMTVGYSNGSVQLSAPAASSLVAGANITISTAGSTISIIGASVAASPVSFSAGTASAALQSVVFSNSNGVSFGLNGSTITAQHNAITTARASTDALGLATAATNVTWTANSAGLSIDAAGYAGTGTSATNASITLNSNGLQISVAAPGGGVTPALSGSNGSFSYSTATFGSSNGMHFYTTNGSLVGSYTVPSTAGLISAVGVTGQNGNFTTTGLSFSNANGISFGTSAGSAITASHNALTTAMASDAVTLSNIRISGGTTSNLLSALTFGNANGISFGLNAGTMTASHNAITTGRASTDAVGLNTAQTNVTWTVNSSGLSINAAGYAGTASSNTGGASFTLNSAGLAFNGGNLAGTTSGFTGANISASITHNTAGLALSMSVAAPGAAVESNWHNLLGANTSGNTTASGSTIGLSGINLTLSGTNGSVVNISAPATSSLVGFRGATVSTNGSTISVGPQFCSYYDNMNGEWGNSTTMQAFQSTSHVQPFEVHEPISFGVVRIPMSALVASSTTAGTTAGTQFSYGHTRSHNFAIYSRGTGASSLSLTTVSTTQFVDQQSQNISASANSTRYSYTNRATYYMSTGASNFNFDYSSSAASLNFHTSQMTAITGQKLMEFPWAVSLTPGQYYLMYGVSSSTASQLNNNGTRWQNIMSMYAASQPSISFGLIGQDTNNSVGIFPGLGSFSTAGGGSTGGFPISAVTTSASHNKMYFALFNIA